METLDDYVVENILLSLDYKDIVRFCSTNKYYRGICDNHTFWKRKLKLEYGSNYYYDEYTSPIENYRLFRTIYDTNDNIMLQNLYLLRETNPEYFNGLKNWILFDKNEDIKNIILNNDKESIVEILNKKGVNVLSIILWIIIIYGKHDLLERIFDDGIVEDVLTLGDQTITLKDIHNSILILIKNGQTLDENILDILFEHYDEDMYYELIVCAARYNDGPIINTIVKDGESYLDLMNHLLESDTEPIIFKRLSDIIDGFKSDVWVYIFDGEIRDEKTQNYYDSIAEILGLDETSYN